MGHELFIGTGGLVLCGGRSSRMGRPKEWLPFGTYTVLRKVVDELQSALPMVIVSATSGQRLPVLPGPVARIDDPVARQGPLVGLAGGILRAHELGWEWVFACAGDMPLLRAELIRRLATLLSDQDDAVVPLHAGHPQPLTAIYRTRTAAALQRRAQAGPSALRDCLNEINTRYIEPALYADIDPDGESFLGVNTPEEYERALQLAGLSPSPGHREQTSSGDPL